MVDRNGRNIFFKDIATEKMPTIAKCVSVDIDPSTWKTEADGSLYIQGQLLLH